MDEGLDLKAYWRLFLRRWWVLLLGMAVGGVVGYILSSSTTPLYEATTKVLVQSGVTPGTPSLSDIQASEQLALNYGDLILTRPILEQVIQELSLGYGTGTLQGKIAVRSPRSLIEITITDSDPDMAATLANAIARTFINDFRDKQFLQIAQFQASLSQYGITQDTSIIAAQASTMSTLRIAEEAVAPSSPSSPSSPITRRDVFLAVVLGLGLAVVIALGMEFFSDKIRGTEELRMVTGMTNLGSVLRYQGGNGLGPVTITLEGMHTAMAESYKFLRANLQFLAVDTGGLGTLLVTSSSPSEGKTTTSANLAISVAREGKSVILVDTDLRKPALHKIFNVDGGIGLTQLIVGDAKIDDVLVPTEVEGLSLIASGPLPPDASYILRSN